MKKAVIICAAAALMLLGGCNNNETSPASTEKNFGSQYGVAAGIADFSTETPDISISNIKTYVGEDIDYSSGVEVKNTDKFNDFQMWVDASKVDIYTEGIYEAVYRFIYDGETMEKTIVVSVIHDDNKPDEPSGDNVANNDNNGSNNNSNNNSTGEGNNNVIGDNSGNADGNGNENVNNAGSSTQNTTNNVNNNGGGNSTTPNGNENNGNKQTASQTTKATTTNNSSTTKNNSTTSKNEATTKRQIITSSGATSTKSYTIGYMNIELLSGSVVKIKCTSSKYIISTRTDVSDIDKQGVKYKVYKLIITYNTGDEQVLETYEEKQ